MNDLKSIDDGLSPAARAALASLRAEDDLPDEARDRVWARLAASQAAVRSDMSERTGVRRPYVGVVIGLAIAAGLALALVGLDRGAQELAAGTRGDAAVYGGAGPATQLVRASDRAASRAEVAEVAEVIEVVEPAVEAAQRPIARERREPVERAVEPVPGDMSTLAAETALLQRAQSAVAAGDPAAALARLDEHARSFADGVMARERDALRVTALCAAGRVDEGTAAARAFLAAHPESLLAERVRGACVRP